MSPRRQRGFTPDAYEAWFLERGLPYFVDHIRDKVRRRLRPGRVLLVAGCAVVLWGVAVAVVNPAIDDLAVSIVLTFPVPVLVVVVYALRSLEATRIAGWALKRTFASLGLLLPLATRALPMLLLFNTFLFINTEVWQVASALSRGVLWGTVFLFSGLALFFLATRLDQELDEFDDQVGADDMLRATAGTRWHEDVRALGDLAPDDLQAQAQVTGLQRANLVLALAISQAVQVFLLALAVFGFFMVFGWLAIDDSVITSWVGEGHPSYPAWGNTHVFSIELTQVAIFLAGFSGLYFTVTAVTDETYRREFFSRVRLELEKAVSVRILYRHRTPTASPDGTAAPEASDQV